MRTVRTFGATVFAIVLVGAAVPLRGDDGVTWTATRSAADTDTVFITVNTAAMKRNTYLRDVLCTVDLFDGENRRVGTQQFQFTKSSPRFLQPGQQYKKRFPAKVGGFATVRGQYMDYDIAVVGSKADDPQSNPPTVRHGRVKATGE